MTRMAAAALALYLVSAQGHAPGRPSATPLTDTKILGVTILDTTVGDALNRLGVTDIINDGPREADHEYEFCYYEPSDRGAPIATVRFWTGVPGGWRYVDMFAVASGADSPNVETHCRALDQVHDLATPGGVKLGLTRAEVLALLGPPKKELAGKLYFEWVGRVPMTAAQRRDGDVPPGKPAYIDGDLTYAYVTIRSGKVVRFQFGRTDMD